MTTLFDQPKQPGPGECCPTCQHIVPHLLRLRAGRKHPKVSHDAAENANRSLSERAAAVIAHLDRMGRQGATDDEIDVVFGWGHQSTTPVTNALRNARKIGWAQDEAMMPIKRLTRSGHWAHVNVLAKHGVNGFWVKPTKKQEDDA